MSKFSLSDLSVTFSIKIDSEDRLDNLRRNLEYYSTYFRDYEIIIVEQGEISRVPEILNGDSSVHHFFIPSKDAHYKTRNLNYASNLTSRQFLMMCDCDVICNPQSLKDGLSKIRHGVSFLAPYNGVAVEIRKTFFKLENDLTKIINGLIFFPKEFNLHLENFDYSKMVPLYGESSYDNTGGCLMYRKKDFYAIGGWNTNFVSYGFEDMEFVHRLKKLGYVLEKLNTYNIYHFEHERKGDSMYNNFYRSNLAEWNNVTGMQQDELRQYSLNGFRRIIMSNDKELSIINTKGEYSIQVKEISKISLSGLSVILPLHFQNNERLYDLDVFLNYLDVYFKDYDVVKVESGSRSAKYLVNKKNAKYIWLPLKVSRVAAISEGLKATINSYIAIWDFLTLIEPKKVDKSFKLLRETGKKRDIRDTNRYLHGLNKRKQGNGLTLLKR